MYKRIFLIIMIMMATISFAAVPNWAVNPYDFEYTASITGQVRMDESILEDPSAMISAWNGNTICGVANFET
ncbi:MAG: hypothetical protein KAI81_09760, partial [Candidatus Marinimicrobia bacterium]|nr:hypothetical protein [Candidatus Neomarinimicrobiota bacterium]